MKHGVQATGGSPWEGGGGTHSQLLLDHAGGGCNGAGCVVLHHLGELRQVPLHELQGFGGLREDTKGWQPAAPPPFVSVSWASVPDRNMASNWHGKPGLSNNAYLSQFHNLGLLNSREHRTSCCSENGGLSSAQVLISSVARRNSHQVLGFLLGNEGGGLEQWFSWADWARHTCSLKTTQTLHHVAML